MLHAHSFAPPTRCLQTSLPDDAVVPTPGTPEANKYLWTFPGCTLEITHNYGTETKPATEKVCVLPP